MQPHGILLVTGPTGSRQDDDAVHGARPRSTSPTSRSSPSRTRSSTRWPGINQIQVKPQIDLTFANALRSIVRQDPGRHHDRRNPRPRDRADRRAVGADRPPGAVDACTPTTPPATVNRLLDMGVEDYLLTSTVIGILAQRLVRTLCPHCREPYTALPEIVAAAGARRASRRQRRRSRCGTRRAARSARRPATSGRISIIEICR